MDFKALREEAGLTLKQLAEMSGFAVGTISDLERTGKGSHRLREKLETILLRKPELSNRLHDRPPQHLVDDIIEQMERVREEMRSLERAFIRLQEEQKPAAPRNPVSSKPASEAEELLDAAEEEDRRQHPE